MSDLKHYGILGMRWGHRKAGGSRTVSVGRGVGGAAREVGGLVKDAIKDDINKVSAIAKKIKGKVPQDSTDSLEARTLKKKNVRELSNKEIQTVITRLNLEKQFNALNPKQVGYGNKIIGNLLNKYGTQLFTSFINRHYTNSNTNPSNSSNDPFDTSNAQDGQVVDEKKLLRDRN